MFNVLTRYATDVSVGDEVLVEKNDQLTPSKVINVASSMMQGKYIVYYHYLLTFFI